MNGTVVVPVLSEAVTYPHFFFIYQIPRKPCVLPSETTNNWCCRKEWVNRDDLDVDKVLNCFGEDCLVPVVHPDLTIYDSVEYSENRLDDFLNSANTEQLYLKDWHFLHDLQRLKRPPVYTVPSYFQSDWLNEYFEFKNDSTEKDYRFIYVGGQGTWTPRHADVFRTHSWSANICGGKEWSFYVPGSDKPVSTVMQKSGEVIFVPSLLEHSVLNLPAGKFTASLNQNWFNASNAHVLTGYLLEQFENAEQEIDDCRHMFSPDDFISQCSLILKTDSGLDLNELREIFIYILKQRLKYLKPHENGDSLRCQVEKLESFELANNGHWSKLLRCNSCDCLLVDCVFESGACRLKCLQQIEDYCTCIPSFIAPKCRFCDWFFTIFDVQVCLKLIRKLSKHKSVPELGSASLELISESEDLLN